MKVRGENFEEQEGGEKVRKKFKRTEIKYKKEEIFISMKLKRKEKEEKIYEEN